MSLLLLHSQGLSPEVREVSAEGLGELVGLTSEEGLKPFVVTITGPLIRIIGDRCGLIFGVVVGSNGGPCRGVGWVRDGGGSLRRWIECVVTKM
jgi:hypothetical protein